MLKKYLSVIGIAVIVLVIGYQITWLYSLNKYYKEQEASQEAAETDDLRQADANLNQNMVLQNTEVIIESYDENGSLMSREVTTPNAEIVGLSRLELMVYANEYKSQASEEELSQGLERMVVQSFSPNTITLVKYYGEPIEEPGYWIAVKDNVVIVYTEDKSEVFEFTNIELWQLPQEVQYDLADGIYVENERELFDFLQTYSS